MLSKRNIKYIEDCIVLARDYDHDLPYHLAAILVKRNRILAVGYNTKKTSTRSTSPWHTLHAEMCCLLSNTDKLGGTLYVARVGGHGRRDVLKARPCAYCRSMIQYCAIKSAYYTIEGVLVGKWDVKRNEEFVSQLNHPGSCIRL